MFFFLFMMPLYACVPKTEISPSIDTFVAQSLQELSSAKEPIILSAQKWKSITQTLWKTHCFEQQKNTQRTEERTQKNVEKDGSIMRYTMEKKGVQPSTGYPLYIALHGGGGAPDFVNDQQWEHMKRYYLDSIETGIYVATRGISNNWNLHFETLSYPLYDRVIDNLILSGEVDPNRIYFLGFSAGGDGVYQIAPRFSDRLAGANMSAGHPNGASPINLYTVPFLIQMGELDGAYNRNKVAVQYALQLEEHQKRHSEGYIHRVFLHKDGTHNHPWKDNNPLLQTYPVLSKPGKWLEGTSQEIIQVDSNAIRWLQQFKRRPHPRHLIWDTQTRAGSRGARANTHYWLHQEKPQGVLEVSVQENTFSVMSAQENFQIFIDPNIVDLEKDIVVRMGEKILFSGRITPDVRIAAQSILLYNDPERIYVALIDIRIQNEP